MFLLEIESDDNQLSYKTFVNKLELVRMELGLGFIDLYYLYFFFLKTPLLHILNNNYYNPLGKE